MSSNMLVQAMRGIVSMSQQVVNRYIFLSGYFVNVVVN